MRRSTNLAILIVAVILGGVAAFLARSWLQSHSARTDAQNTVSILVTNGTLAFGATIGAEDVREIDWPAKSKPDRAFGSFAELAKNGRQITISPFVRDEPIIGSKVREPDQRASLSTVIEKGQRAVTVAVDDVRGVAGFIFPGDFVDVVLTRTDNSNGPQGTVKANQYRRFSASNLTARVERFMSKNSATSPHRGAPDRSIEFSLTLLRRV